MIKDCNELRETLAEVEKSRLGIKSKLNSCRFNCATLNNQLKKRDLELEDIKRKLNSYGEEKKFFIIVSTTIKVIESIFNVVSIVFLGSNVFHRVSDNSNNIINKYH